MARRTDGGIRFRPVGGAKRSLQAPAYSPAGTGCPAYEQAVENLYKGQNEESFWTLMSALNYALVELVRVMRSPIEGLMTFHRP